MIYNVCPKCGGNISSFRHMYSKRWCSECGLIVREEGFKEDLPYPQFYMKESKGQLKEKTVNYKCVCSFPGYSMNIQVNGTCIQDFQEGFWVDKDFMLSKGESCKYWIPPSAILYIEKEIGMMR